MLSHLRYLVCCLLLCCFTIVYAAQQLVTLNFKDMDIDTLVNMIAEITKKTFVVDPRVKATVTVVSSNPMNSEQVYQVFLSILSVHGFTAIPSGAVIKIVPEGLAKADNTPVLDPKETSQGDSLVTQIVKLEHVSAAQLIPLLRPLLPQEGHLVAYPVNNTLIISDRASNVSRLLKIIRRIDQESRDEIEVAVLEHASATEVARILTTLEQKNTTNAAATGTTNTINVIADERTNSLLISGAKADRLRLRTLITHLDTPLKHLGNTQVIYLRYALAKDLMAVLKGVSEGMVEPKKDGQSATAPATQTMKTMIQADESTNSLIITATPDVLQNLQSVIRQLDVRRAQVLVEAVIAEVSTDTAKEVGVQWILDGSKYGTAPIGSSNFDNLGKGVGIVDLAKTASQIRDNLIGALPSEAGAFLGLSRFNSSSLNFAVVLRALSSDTNTNVLSTPSILTLDNQEAEIKVGQNVPFVTGQYTTNATTTTGVTNPFQTIQRQDVGLLLKVKPQINEGNSVKLTIEQEVSSVTRSTIATADIVTNKRTIKTAVIVEDGSMVVLGGLIDEDLEHSAQKVPVLGDIPILGALFRSQSTKKVKRNLMVFLHPVIVRDANTETLISNNKYSYMRAKQLEQKSEGLSLLSTQEFPVMPELNEFMTILPGDYRQSDNKPSLLK